MNRLAIAAAIGALAPGALAQTDPLFVRTPDNLCWYDGYNQYRITYTEHHLGFNQTTGLYYVEIGCFGQAFGAGEDQAVRTYTAVVSTDPCTVVDAVQAFSDTAAAHDTGCGLWTPQQVIDLGPTAITQVPGQGIQLQPQGGPGGVGISYTVEWDTPYDYRVMAVASGPNSGGSSVVVEQGTLLSAQFGNSCDKCAALLPSDPPPPPPPPPPVPPGSGGGGPNGETGPDWPGGPDNPEGIICCEFADGTFQEMTYDQCVAAGGNSWSPAPCPQPIGCCFFMDPSTGEFVEVSVTQAECVTLEGTWSPEACEDSCADCCEAIRALLESFTGDVQEPLRNWLLEDWPDFSARVLDVLEQPDAGIPVLEGVTGAQVEGIDGDADTYFNDLSVPDDATGSTAWQFDVLGTSATFDITLDPRNWPDDAMHSTLAAFILLMRFALAIGLTIMFGSMVGRVLRQW